MRAWIAAALAAITLAVAAPAFADPPAQSDRYARNGDVRIHYVAQGEGPLVIAIHGFPDYWYTWRTLMPALADRYRVAAMDLRGYNLSDKPRGVEAYGFAHLIADIDAVMAAEGAERATIIGHDWGAAIAWQYAMRRPERVQNLVILNVPHPAGFAREMAGNAAQQENSQYARDFMQPGAERALSAEGLANWVQDPEARARYVEAFRRSSFAGMLNYYRANYPSASGAAIAPQTAAQTQMPKIRAPTLIIHGLDDRALNAAGHNGTWDWIEADTTLVMIPHAGHFVQHDAGALVNRAIADWLDARRAR